MSDDHIRLLAKKFLEGTASNEEIKTLMDWYAAHGDAVIGDNATIGHEETIEIETDIPDLENRIHARMHQRLQSRIRGRKEPRIHQRLEPGNPSITIPLYRRPWAKPAAAIIAILIAGAWLWQQQTQTRQHKTESAPLVEHKVPKQKRQQFRLPDGSQVWVNADSRLQYAADFSRTSREVYLEGEAFFDVKQDPDRPFIVHTAHATTKVLGTAFNVKAYKEDSQSSVTVLQGKVEVEDVHHHKSQIVPNRQALVDIGTGQLTDKPVTAESYHAWTRGALEFNGESFGEVARILNRRFGVDIRFENEALANCTFIATFEENDSFDKIIALLCKTNASSYRTDASTQEIVISGKSCI